MVEVTDTAAVIARLRAEESARPPGERLFDDPCARLFAGGAAADEGTRLMLEVPFMREYVRTRTRFIDDAVREALAGGLRQLVLLGAGYDTRALRMPEIAAAGASVFEVDLAAQLESKRAILTRAGVEVPARDRYLPCDFRGAGWELELLGELERAGFRTGAGALFVWEGVIGYLDDWAIERSLAFMARAGGSASRLVLNYPAVRFPAERLAGLLVGAGFTPLEDEAVGAVYLRYVPGDRQPDDDLFRLAVAEVR